MRVLIFRPLSALLALVLISCSANAQCFFGSLDMGNSGGHTAMPAMASMNDSHMGTTNQARTHCSGHAATSEKRGSDSSSAEAPCCSTKCGPANLAPASLTIALKQSSARSFGRSGPLLGEAGRFANGISPASLHGDAAQSFLCVFRL
jgi:hypothetical protein